MKLNVGCVTDRGNCRSKNQDSVICDCMTVGEKVLAVACVCDGIGSFSQSEIASEMVTTGILNWFDGVGRNFPRPINKADLILDLEVTIQELNELVYEYCEKTHIDIGCTMSLIFVYDFEYFIFHVGDSRIYCLQDRLFRMTQDEVVLKLIGGREKTLLVNYIGKNRKLYVNMQHGNVNAGDVFILGSDGLYKKLIYEDVKDLFRGVSGNEEIQIICRKLVDLVMERNEKDNISCAVLQVVGEMEQ
ncbi:MAG: serine/threonine-protein phosphatase [Lachnospiraceae bacterium]|nr:serine/threonine-protein phosphatase [Lachnospiraceae bacterium]